MFMSISSRIKNQLWLFVIKSSIIQMSHSQSMLWECANAQYFPVGLINRITRLHYECSLSFKYNGDVKLDLFLANWNNFNYICQHCQINQHQEFIA